MDGSEERSGARRRDRGLGRRAGGGVLRVRIPGASAQAASAGRGGGGAAADVPSLPSPREAEAASEGARET